MGKFVKKYEASRIFKVTLQDNTELTLKNYPNKFQKRLLAATISEDSTLIYKEIISVLSESIIAPENFNLSEVPYFDIHKIFLALVANSYQNKISVNINCDNEVEVKVKDQENEEEKLEKTTCSGTVKSVIDLEQIQIEHLKDLTYKTNNFEVIFRYPNFEEYILFLDKLAILDPTEKFIAISALVQNCLDIVQDDEGSDKFKELDWEDQQFIIESLPADVLSTAAVDLIKPYICVQIPFICPECGHKKKVELKGLDSFFR